MNAPLAVEVAAAGAVTCVGWNLAATTAAIHAGVDNFDESQFLDEQREPLVVAAVPRWRPDDDPPLRGTPWLAQLGCRALAECLAASPAPNLTILLVPPDPLRVPDLPRLVEQLHAAWPEAHTQAPHAPPRLSLSFAPTLDGTRPDLLTTLAHARGLLARREATSVVVAGVDSWLNATVVEHGLQQRLLLTTGERGGRIPGEGAAAVLLRVATTAGGVQLCGLGRGHEDAVVGGDVPNYGVGLAAAMREALREASLALHDIDLQVSDVAGDAYGFEEAAYAWGRLLRKAQPPGNDYILPATRVGDIGAATGPLMLGVLWRTWLTGRRRDARVLLHYSSTDTRRSAVIVRATPPRNA